MGGGGGIPPIIFFIRLFSEVWSANDALLKRMMKIHSNPLILYYGFKNAKQTYILK